MSRQQKWAITAVALMLAGVGGTSCDNPPTSPSAASVATFQVGDESFRVLLITPEQVRAAEAAQAGGRASIPVGRIVTGSDINTGWTWHLENVTFVEVAIELCDGLPSFVERQGPAFGNGLYCPWLARVTNIRQLI